MMLQNPPECTRRTNKPCLRFDGLHVIKNRFGYTHHQDQRIRALLHRSNVDISFLFGAQKTFRRRSDNSKSASKEPPQTWRKANERHKNSYIVNCRSGFAE